jgi:predicted outer membrane repeat protein
MAVYGGFAGGETLRDQRAPGLNVTTLSGDIGTPGVATDNSWTVVKMIGTAGNPITASTVLDGFTISDGHNSGLGDGLYCNGKGAGNECSPTLASLIFDGNYSHDGGALYNDGSNGGISNPHLTNVTFINNLALQYGGAMCNDGSSGGNSSPVLNGVAFVANTTDGGLGGAMSDLGNSSPLLENVTFSGNGGATNVYPPSLGHTAVGGAIYVRSDGSGTLSLNNVTFNGNSAPSGDGGAIYVASANAMVLVSNTILWGDSSGGTNSEIFNNGSVTITSSVIQGGCPAASTCVGVIASDPLLGSLQDNGGPTQTMLLMPGSSAIGAGYNPSCASTDQRGVPRPQGANCDVGAVEIVLDRIFADNFDGRPTP